MQVKVDIINPYVIEFVDGIKLDFSSKVALITSPKIYKLHKSRIDLKNYYLILIDDSEESKNFKSINFILDKLFSFKFNRDSVLLALGGGVISDMVGFVASIYMRGIKFINIPTTLLAMVDASVGGKTGINSKFGKNLIGSFYQPQAVFIDISFLKTLKKDDFKNAFSEIVKLAIALDSDFFNFLSSVSIDDENLKQIIYKSVSIKADVVKKDEKEQNLRRVLNFGHTFAHAIELESEFKIPHCKAVAIGIKMALSFSLKLKFISKLEFDKIIELLKKFDIFYEYKIEDENRFYDMFLLDKKTKNSKINFILIGGVGKFKIVDFLKKDEILELLRDFKWEFLFYFLRFLAFL